MFIHGNVCLSHKWGRGHTPSPSHNTSTGPMPFLEGVSPSLPLPTSASAKPCDKNTSQTVWGLGNFLTLSAKIKYPTQPHNNQSKNFIHLSETYPKIPIFPRLYSLIISHISPHANHKYAVIDSVLIIFQHVFVLFKFSFFFN